MSNDGDADRHGPVGRLDDDTIDTLLDADLAVREYLSKASGGTPIKRTVAEWEDDYPEDTERIRADETIRPYLNLLDEDDFLGHSEVDELSEVEQRFLDDLRASVYDEIREVQRRLTLTPTEFVVYLLSTAAGWSDDEIAAEIDASPDDVAAHREDARDRFRTAMRMVDLCDRVDDPELAENLEAWGIHRDPLV
jgi:DNA-binding CsgD family transcriptional regulator